VLKKKVKQLKPLRSACRRCTQTQLKRLVVLYIILFSFRFKPRKQARAMGLVITAERNCSTADST